MERDRTNEFKSILSITQSKNNYKIKNGNLPRNIQKRSEFLLLAQKISDGVYSCYLKLENLGKLCKNQSLFDDTSQEINDLTYIIKLDVVSLKKQLEELSNIFSLNNQRDKNNEKLHKKSIITTLEKKLACVSKNFQNILEDRNDNEKRNKNRLNKISKEVNIPTLIDSSIIEKNDIKYRSASSCTENDTIIDMNDLIIDNKSRSQSDSQVKMQDQLLIMEETVPSYMNERLDAVKTIESTIIELGQIFQQLAHLVNEQDEQIQRIDQNIEISNLHIEHAHQQLIQYFKSISSNRWLMIKIFAILFLFILLFIFLS